MNSLSRQVADMTDAQLYIAYVRLYERLGSKAAGRLCDGTDEVAEERAKAATDGMESEGGSLAPIEANNAEVTYTEKRLKELRARLKKITNKDDDE